MGLKFKNILFSNIKNENSLRFDVDFLTFNSRRTLDNSIAFSELFDIVVNVKVNTEALELFKYAEISDVTKTGEVYPNYLDIDKRDETTESYFKKIEKGDILLPKENDILISSVRPNLKKIVLVDVDNEIYFTKAFIHLRPKRLNEILYHTLREIFFENLIAISRQGKGYPTLKSNDLKGMKFDREIIDNLHSKKDGITSLIRKINKRITNLKSQIKPDLEVINEIFSEYFGWDTKQFIELKDSHLIISSLSAFSSNVDNRFSFKFHNKAGAYVSQILKSQSSKRIKDYLAEDITLGKSISPADYEENGEQFYASMADIKNWSFETEEAKTVSFSYFEANPNKRIVQNDILMARSGEGTIGKVAIIDTDENEAVYSDFMMRIRLKDYNPTFAYYYFRTDFFQYLVYTHKKGLGNNTNIFPSQLREFPIPGISTPEQTIIVAAIKTEIDKQREIDKKIEAKKEAINKIIQESIL